MPFNFWERWPWTSFENLNLDWLMKATKQAVETANTAAASVGQFDARITANTNAIEQLGIDVETISSPVRVFVNSDLEARYRGNLITGAELVSMLQTHGDLPFVEYNGEVYALDTASNAGDLRFSMGHTVTGFNDLVIRHIMIPAQSSNAAYSITNVGGGSGTTGNVFAVTITPQSGSYVSDHTYSEIYSQMLAGKIPVLLVASGGNTVFDVCGMARTDTAILNGQAVGCIRFADPTWMTGDSNSVGIWTIYADNTVGHEAGRKQLATLDNVFNIVEEYSGETDWNTLADAAESRETGLFRVGGYELRNIVAHPYASTLTQHAHSEPYYDVNAVVDKYSTINYNDKIKLKNILNNLPQEEIDFTPSDSGFTRIVVGKNSDDQFFVAYVASDRLGAFGNPKFDSLEMTSDFVNFNTILKGCEPANPELVNPSDWQLGKNWTGASAENRAVIYVPVTAGQTYDISTPNVDWVTDGSLIQKSGNSGGNPSLGSQTISNGVITAVEAVANASYFCFQINANRTITSADIAAYSLSVSLHDTRGGIVIPNMTNIKVASIKQFSDGTYIVAIRCKDVRDNSNYTHFYRMTGNMLGITHCTYTNFSGQSVDMIDEYDGNVYDWHIFVEGNKALATTYGNRNPATDLGRVWYTENCGGYWKQVFQTSNHLQDGQESGVIVTEAHTHGVMIDSIDSLNTRLYVIVGENNRNIFWTDKGMNATDNDWNVIDIANQPFYNFQTFTQVVNGYPFKDGLIFGSDNEGIGCLYRINKLDDGGYSDIEPAHEFLPNYYNGTTYCAAEMSKRDLHSPLLVCETHEGAMYTEADNEGLNQRHKARIAATYDGINIIEIWSDDTYGAHDAYIDGQVVTRNYSYCTRGMGAWLLKNGNIVIKYSGRDYYYFGGNPLFSVQGISNGCCKVRIVKGAENFL